MRCATIRVGNERYTIELPFGRMIKCVSKGDTLVYPHGESGEVLSVNDGKARVQGMGREVFTICRGGSSSDVEVNFNGSAVNIEM